MPYGQLKSLSVAMDAATGKNKVGTVRDWGWSAGSNARIRGAYNTSNRPEQAGRQHLQLTSVLNSIFQHLTKPITGQSSLDWCNVLLRFDKRGGSLAVILVL